MTAQIIEFSALHGEGGDCPWWCEEVGIGDPTPTRTLSDVPRDGWLVMLGRRRGGPTTILVSTIGSSSRPASSPEVRRQVAKAERLRDGL